MKSISGYKTALPFLIPSLIGFAVFSVLPIAITIIMSLTNWDGLSQLTFSMNFFDQFFVGLSNYTEIFSTPEFYKVLGNTMLFVVLYVPPMLAFSLIIARVLNSKIKAVGVFRVVYYIPVITSWVAGSLIWRWILNPEYGGINNLLRTLIGIEGPAWLFSPTWAMPAIVMASVWKDMGYFGLMFLAGLQAIDRQYYEASRIDGASKWGEFRHITLPLLSPTMFFVIIISIIMSFQIFPQVMVMTPDGGVGGSTMVMMERIYKYAFSYYKIGYSAAFSLVLFIIIYIVTAFQMWLQKKWVHYDD